jgi:hypothetical protein
MRRILVTLHYPLEMACVAAILRAVSIAYPDARGGEDGNVWDGPEITPEPIDAATAAERVAVKRAARRAAL